MDALERKRVYERVEANKKANKTYEDLKKEVEAGNKSGASASDKIGAKAAALTMADKEMFESSDDFKNALEAVGGDMDSVTKIIRKAPKEMLRSGDDLAKALESVREATKDLRQAAQAQIKNQLIDKAGSGALPTTATEYERMLNSFKDKTGTIDTTLKGALESKMKKEGKIKALVDFNSGGTANATNYQTVLKDFKAQDLANQSSIFKDAEFYKYIRNMKAAGTYDKTLYLEAFRHMKEEDRRKWISEVGTP